MLNSDCAPLWKKSQSPFVLLTLLIVLGLLACGPNTVEVGVVLPLTGDDAAYGQAALRGVELAFDALKDTEETRFELNVVDSGSDPAEAARLLGELYDQGALVAIGGLTPGEAESMVDVAEAAERVLLSPSSGSELLSAKSRYFYRLAPADVTAGNTMAHLMRREYEKDTTAATLACDATVAVGVEAGFSSAFRSQGGEILGAFEGETGGALDTILELDPDLVYLAGLGSGLADAVQELRASGFKGKILATREARHQSTLGSVADAAAGIRYTSTVLDLESEQAQAFATAYHERFEDTAESSGPSLYTAEAYDAFNVLVAAFDGRPAIASSARKGLRDGVKNFPGVTGTLQFNESGEVSKFPRVYRLAEDLTVIDEKQWLQAERERIEAERQAILERLRNIQGSGAGSVAAAGS